MQEIRFDERDIKKIFRADTPTLRLMRFVRRTVLSLIYIGLLFGVFFYGLNFSAFLKRFQYETRANTNNIAVIDEPKPEPVVEIPDYAPLVEIPKISVSAPLLLNVAPDLIVDQLRVGVTHYEATALPGEIGNSVIVGHSSDLPWSDGQYKTVFALLDKLVLGDKVVVYYKKQRLVYSVTSSKVVAPTDLSVLRRSTTPQITLLTCYPVGTTRNRLIVTAELIEGVPTGTQVSEPAIGSALPRPR